MSTYEIIKNEESGKREIRTSLKGAALLANPKLNKSTAFTLEERERLGLFGLLPASLETLEGQINRCYLAYHSKLTDLGKHINLRALQDRNETLFYATLNKHIEEMLPIIYAPVVGAACQKYHEIYRVLRGLFVSYPQRDKIKQMLDNVDLPDVKVIVVSDGERILGLGDQGANGIGIPIGKITLYSSCGGINPVHGLPVLLDTGTDNEILLNHPLYFGWRHSRIRGKEYDDFVDAFIEAVLNKFPNVLLQWEDFARDNAQRLLDRYKERICSFNDDIQGTAAVALAGLHAAVKTTASRMRDQQVVIFGAGSAGTGIAGHIVQAMVEEGISEKEARERIWMIDRHGLIHTELKDLTPFQKIYSQPIQKILGWKVENRDHITLEDVVRHLHPTILIGVSTQFGAFNESIVREMAKHVRHPIIFPLSNPPSKCEGDPNDLIQWTDGRGLIATGTKYPDVEYNGKHYKIGQCNNYYIFPAMGLGVLCSGAKRITDKMFLVAARALGEFSPALENPLEGLFPSPALIHTISQRLAFVIGKEALKEGIGDPITEEELLQRIKDNFWLPEYLPIITRDH